MTPKKIEPAAMKRRFTIVFDAGDLCGAVLVDCISLSLGFKLPTRDYFARARILPLSKGMYMCPS